MKITDISTHILRTPLGERFYSSQAVFPERTSLIVRIATDDGLVGWGEGGEYGPPSPVACVINNVIAPLLVGQSLQPPGDVSRRSCTPPLGTSDRKAPTSRP